MSIFGKKPENESQPATQPTPAAPPPRPAAGASPGATATVTGHRSYLGSDCRLKGSLTGEGSFECGGTFDGTIDITGDVTIGNGGTANAQLKARRISIDGRLHGDATGTEKVEVGASGHVEGDVRAPAVQFAEGAFFEGNVEMRRAEGGAADAASAGPDNDATTGDARKPERPA